MEKLFEENLKDTIALNKIIAVLIIENIEDTRPILDALVSGGIRTVELTFRTEAAIEALGIIKKHYPQISVGAGTILTTEQIDIAKEEGADFAVAPGCNRRIIEKALLKKLSFAPGISSPSDIETALEYHAPVLKFFPAEPLGGLKYLEAINAPYQHRDISYIPLGGINQNNLQKYAASPLIKAVGGSWLTSKKLIAEKNWDGIKKNAEEAISAL